jgi:hypothetical protein
MCLHASLAGGLTLAQDIWRPDPLDSYLTSSEFARLVPLRLHAEALPVSPTVKGPARRIDLAKIPADDEHFATVLQPDLQKITVSDLPPLFYWAEQQPAPQDQVLSPSWKKEEAKLALTSEPRLGVPNQQVPGEHTVSPRPAADAPTLVVPAGSGGLPLRDLSLAQKPRMPFGWSKMGDAVNALVLSSAEAPADRVILLPPGSNSGGSASESGAGLDASTRSRSADTSAAVDRTSPTKSPLAAIQEVFHPAEYATAEYPPDSAFDVIATHSSSEDALPHASVKLSGAPVYTAFVPVGPGKEWIFQYCLMRSSRPAADESRFISLHGAESIQAPFPTFTVLPKAVAQTVSSYALVHAILTPAGRLKAITVVGLAEQSYAARLTHALSAWHFRPVFLNDQPVEAEILMAISRDAK